jgi:hypothetical protein
MKPTTVPRASFNGRITVTRWTTRLFEIFREDWTIHRLRISVEVPYEFRSNVDELLQKCYAKNNGHLTFSVELPRQARSTGPRSINNRIHGHCENLAEQIPPDKDGKKFTADEVYAAMKRMSVSEGYPTYLSLDGIEEPLPMRYSSQDQALIVSRVIQRYADTHNFWLIEYDETVKPPVPYRSLGGRTRTEMAAYEVWEGEV